MRPLRHLSRNFTILILLFVAIKQLKPPITVTIVEGMIETIEVETVTSGRKLAGLDRIKVKLEAMAIEATTIIDFEHVHSLYDLHHSVNFCFLHLYCQHLH
jgi:hypothetical protein